jgi:hypothetical protein
MTKLTPLHEIAKRLHEAAEAVEPYDAVHACKELAIEVERWAGLKLYSQVERLGLAADLQHPLDPLLTLVREAERRPRENDADNATLREIREMLKRHLAATGVPG